MAPANAFVNLAPNKLSFKAGGVTTAVLGTVILPWKLMADASGYIFVWLIGYSALLGPIAGIMIADYYLAWGGKGGGRGSERACVLTRGVYSHHN